MNYNCCKYRNSSRWKQLSCKLKNCAPLTNCINELNNTQADDTKKIVAVMPMYNSLEYN